MDVKRLKNYADKVREVGEDLERFMFAKVTGVTFEGRQELLKKMTRDTSIKMLRERRNKYDSYAIQVLADINGEWLQVGFIPRPMNVKIARSLDNGVDLSVEVHRVLGGMVDEQTGERFNFGLDICIKPER